MHAACAIVPAYQAAATIADVVGGLRAALGVPVIVVDDGSLDATATIAREHGALVIRHEGNRGKGAALRTGLCEAGRLGCHVAVSVDADAQHPPDSALAVLRACDDSHALVLGVRNLIRDGAPSSNRFGNSVSNFFLSMFSGHPLRDTQCGLRRYPVDETLALHVRANGYAFEAEVILRALARGLAVVEVPITVRYPVGGQTHRRSFADPTQIVMVVARTAAELRLGRKSRVV